MAKRMAKQMELFEPVERGFDEGGLMDEGGMVDEESGNEVPPGSLREEVRDDIPAQLSEGEFVMPADVVRYHGLDKMMALRDEAKIGLQRMEDMGQMGNSEEAIIPDGVPFDVEDLEVENEEEDNLEFQVGGYVPGMYQRPMMQPQPYSPYGQQPPSVFGPQPSSVQPSFTYTPDRSNLPTFQQTIGPGVPYVDFEYVEYVNDAGQIVRLRRSKTTGKLLDPVPVGFRPKSQKVTTPTTQVTTPREDNDGGRDMGIETARTTGTVTGYTSPSSVLSKVGGFLTKDVEANANAFGGSKAFGLSNAALRSATLDQAMYQLGSISPTGAIASALSKQFGFTNATMNDMAVAGQQGKQAALTTLGFTRASQLQTSNQATMYGNMISAAHAAAKKGEDVTVALAKEMNNPAYDEVVKDAAVSAMQELGYTSDQMSNSTSVNAAIGGYRAAADAYRDDAAATRSSGTVRDSKGNPVTSKSGVVMTQSARDRMNAELEAARTAEAKADAIAAEQARSRGNVARDDAVMGTPSDTDVANAKDAAAAATAADAKAGKDYGDEFGNIADDDSSDSSPGMGNTGTDTSGEESTGGEPSGGNDGSDNDGPGSDDGPGTYICTASYANGIILRDHFTSLKKYGIMLRRNDPYLMKAYDWFGPKLAAKVKDTGWTAALANLATAYYKARYTNTLSAKQKIYDKVTQTFVWPTLRLMGWVLTKANK